MKTITVFASDHCLGWEELLETVTQLRDDHGFEITIKDPLDHEKEFYSHGLVICPSILYGDQLITVGVPDTENLYWEIRDRIEAENHADQLSRSDEPTLRGEQ